jgi:ribosomal-protein-alanine N-acetyltransferase
MNIVPYPCRLKDEKAYVDLCLKTARKRKRTDYHFVIKLRSGKCVIGGVGITKFDRFNETAEVWYWLGEKYWGQGIATEALEPLIEFAFDRLKIGRLEANIFRWNKASAKLLEKFGFKKEGLRRKVFKAKSTGKLHDSYTYGLLKSDCKL